MTPKLVAWLLKIKLWNLADSQRSLAQMRQWKLQYPDLEWDSMIEMLEASIADQMEIISALRRGILPYDSQTLDSDA